MLAAKNWNDLFSPTAVETINGVNTYNLDGKSQCQLQVGSKLYLEYPMRSHQESVVYKLRKPLGHKSSSVHHFTVKGNEYKSAKYVVAIDAKKVLEAGFSGLNTKAGDLLTVKFKHNTPAAGGAVAATRIVNYC